LDHVELAPVPELAGVSDRGRRHTSNEDALSLDADVVDELIHVLVVCDGVSQARDAQRAALVAADATRTALLQAARDAREPTLAMHQAIRAAHDAICALPDEPLQETNPKKTQPPGCTLVAALVRDGHATIGWVGDSRAYRFGSDLAELLTHDHSWFNAVVEAGELTPAEAAASPNRDAIVQAVGPLNYDEGSPPTPPQAEVVERDLSDGQLLLLCSDGLWKYAAEPDALAALINQLPRGVGPLAVSRSLVEYANARGGTDNVTAAILFTSQEAL
jgi:PPM family protein phosphatase